MADIAHQEGNAAYKKGDLEKAGRSFALAAKLVPTEPKHPSNLSAVLYEQGQYTNAIEAILASWRCLRLQNGDDNPRTPLLTDALALKLVVRFAKAKLNGVASGIISLHDKKPRKKSKSSESNFGIEADIEGFVDSVLEAPSEASDSKSQEIRAAWGDWRAVKEQCSLHTAEECLARANVAQRRLRSMSIFKLALDPVLEYYRFGNDPVRSLLDGVNNSPNLALDGNVLKREGYQTLALLFGGSGDARHVFGTLSHFAERKRSFRGQDKKPALHLTLVDIHPATLARVMLVFALMRKIIQTPLSNSDKRLELETTIFYLYSTMLMPEYCSQIVIDTARELIIEFTQGGRKVVSKCLHVDDYSLSRILPILEYWSKPLPKSTKTFLQFNDPNSLNNIFMPKNNSLNRNAAFQSALNSKLDELGLVNANNDAELPLYNNPKAEEELYETVRILLPPKKLLNRHPQVAKYVRKQSAASQAALRREVEETWKPNATLFDNNTTEHAFFAAPGGYPILSSSPFTLLKELLDFAIHFIPPQDLSLDQTAFAIIHQFFDLATNAVQLLGESLSVEFVASDLYDGLPRLLAGDFGPRPVEFPKKFLRMWLSNVPDYTGGTLSTIIHLFPRLQQSQYSMIISNCLLNPSSFKTIKDLSFNYTYLNTFELRRILSALLRDDHGNAFEEMNLSPVARSSPFSSSVSKQELHSYLSLMLIRTVCSAKSGQMPFRVDEPVNLVGFVHLLIYLCRTAGAPAHWVGDFLQSVVNDTLVTDVVAFTGTLPITPPEKAKRAPAPRKVNLDPWQAELETILVSSKHVLPFHVTLPPRYAAAGAGEIRTYWTAVTSTITNRFEVGHLNRAVALLFYKAGPNSMFPVSQLPSRIADLIEKKDQRLTQLEVQILLAQEAVDILKGEVSWRMSRTWFEKMRAEEWKMLIYVTNKWVTVCKPVEAKLWKDVGEIEG